MWHTWISKSEFLNGPMVIRVQDPGGEDWLLWGTEELCGWVEWQNSLYLECAGSMILFIETYNIVHKRVNFTICKSYVNKSDF